ncbi:MAG: nitroreductase family protein [Candidatus Aenigmarchaeota archaeon]|nr:nitroreductase family protein [Candidatus Aenigmarchaeota archaeon]
METSKAIMTRKSVRNFKKAMISQEIIDKLLRAGKYAPSAGGLQSQSFLVFTKTEDKQDLSLICYNQDFMENASAIIIVLVDEERIKRKYGVRGSFYAICDGAAAGQNILLIATDLDLGSCWIGAFDEGELKRFLKTELKPVIVIPVGYEDVI